MTLLIQGDRNISKMAMQYGLKASFRGGATHE